MTAGGAVGTHEVVKTLRGMVELASTSLSWKGREDDVESKGQEIEGPSHHSSYMIDTLYQSQLASTSKHAHGGTHTGAGGICFAVGWAVLHLLAAWQRGDLSFYGGINSATLVDLHAMLTTANDIGSRAWQRRKQEPRGKRKKGTKESEGGEGCHRNDDVVARASLGPVLSAHPYWRIFLSRGEGDEQEDKQAAEPFLPSSSPSDDLCPLLSLLSVCSQKLAFLKEEVETRGGEEE